MDYKIIVDSCCDMTAQLKKRLGVLSVPMFLRLGQKEYIDDDTLDLAKFMDEMAECTDKITTAAPSPASFQSTIEGAENSFVITLSDKLSTSYANAVLGKKSLDEQGSVNTHVFTSLSASAGETLVAVKLRELLSAGMSIENIIQTVNTFIENMKTYFVLENYDTLVKNGRMGKITGRIISVLNIKLIMGSDGHGNIAMHGNSRGTNQMINKIMTYIKNSGRNTGEENMVISHCNNPGLAERVSAAVKQQFDFKEIIIVPTGGISSVYAADQGIIMAF